MDLIWRSEKINKFGDSCHFAPIVTNFLRAKIYPNKVNKFKLLFSMLRNCFNCFSTSVFLNVRFAFQFPLLK